MHGYLKMAVPIRANMMDCRFFFRLLYSSVVVNFYNKSLFGFLLQKFSDRAVAQSFCACHGSDLCYYLSYVLRSVLKELFKFTCFA